MQKMQLYGTRIEIWTGEEINRIAKIAVPDVEVIQAEPGAGNAYIVEVKNHGKK